MTDVIKEGYKLYRRKKFSEALTILLPLHSAETEGDPDLSYLTGLCLARMNRHDEAITYLEQVVTMNVDFARIYQCRLALAVLYALTERTKLADFELKKLTELGYESPQVFSALGYVAYSFGNAEESLKWYEKALEMDENNATAMNGLGYILADTEKDLDRALYMCKKALGISPENPAYLDSIAWAYYKLGFNKEAMIYAEQAREKLPDNNTVKQHFEKISKVQENLDYRPIV